MLFSHLWGKCSCFCSHKSGQWFVTDDGCNNSMFSMHTNIAWWAESMTQFSLVMLIGWNRWVWSLVYTVECHYECHYNAVQFFVILLQWQQQNVNHTSNSQQTSHTLPSQVSYGVSFMRIQEKIDHVIMALNCMCSKDSYLNILNPWNPWVI